MMNITGIVIAAIITIIAYIIIYKLIRSLIVFQIIFKVAMVVFTLLIAALVVGIFFVVDDAMEFNKQFPNSTNMFLLRHDGKYVSGIALDPKDQSHPITLSAKQLDEISDSIKSDKEPDGYYKAIVIDSKILEDDNSTFNPYGFDITSMQMREVLDSDDAKDDLAGIIASTGKISRQDASRALSSQDDDDVKAELFGAIIREFLSAGNTREIVEEFKDGNIEVYKETSMFKALHYTPRFIIGDSIDGLSVEQEEMAGSKSAQLK